MNTHERFNLPRSCAVGCTIAVQGGPEMLPDAQPRMPAKRMLHVGQQRFCGVSTCGRARQQVGKSLPGCPYEK